MTKFKINWDDSSTSNGQSTSNGNGVTSNGDAMASHEDAMTSHEDEENCPPPPPPSNPYLPENMRRPNPLPLQKDPNLVKCFEIRDYNRHCYSFPP